MANNSNSNLKDLTFLIDIISLKLHRFFLLNFRFLDVDVAAVANNHLSDFGEKSIRITIQALKEKHIHVSGANDRSKNYPLQVREPS